MAGIIADPSLHAPPQQIIRKLSWWRKLQSRRIRSMLRTGSSPIVHRKRSCRAGDDELSLFFSQDISLITDGTPQRTLVSVAGRSQKRQLRFQSDDKLECVRLLEANPFRREWSYSAKEYLRIRSIIGLSVKEGRKQGLGECFEGLRPNLECPKVQKRLNHWTILGGSVRGMEGAVNRRLGLKRQRHRTLHVRHIVFVQELLKKRGTTLNTAEELRRSSEISSLQSVLFAHMMGKADEIAASFEHSSCSSIVSTDDDEDMNDKMNLATLQASY